MLTSTQAWETGFARFFAALSLLLYSGTLLVSYTFYCSLVLFRFQFLSSESCLCFYISKPPFLTLSLSIMALLTFPEAKRVFSYPCDAVCPVLSLACPILPAFLYLIFGPGAQPCSQDIRMSL